MKISWKTVHPFFHDIANKHGSRKKKNQPRIQGVNRNIPKLFQIIPCLMSVLWPFSHNVVNMHGLPRNKSKKKSCVQRVEREHHENVPNHSFHQVPHAEQISWKCVQLFLRNVAYRQRQTNQKRWKHNLRRSVEVIIASVMSSGNKFNNIWNFRQLYALLKVLMNCC